MTDPNVPKSPSLIASEPVAIAGATLALLQAAMVVLAVFHVASLTGEQQAAVQGLVSSVWALVGAAYARGRSVSRAALESLNTVGGG